jgi:rhombotail lipoprotein
MARHADEPPKNSRLPSKGWGPLQGSTSDPRLLEDEKPREGHWGDIYMRNFLVLLVLAILVTGCTTLWQELSGNNLRKGVSSSLVDYLYPNGEVPPAQDKVVPNLNLPLNIGLAFVPSYDADTPGLSEAHKMDLLAKVKTSFEERDFIREIVVIPDTYLRSRKGFDTFDQVARLYGLDVLALVSYDQVVHSDDTKASILYWTIVGAYFVKGSKNDVQTFVDTAIFDVRTHKLLFRAPGVDTVKATSTLINSVDEMRKARENSFSNAMADMTQNLGKELDSFRERIKTNKTVTISKREGYTGGGGGALDIATMMLMLAGYLAFRIVGSRKLRLG